MCGHTSDTSGGAPGRRAVVAYAGAATAARMGDAGAGLGIVLLAVSRYGTGRGAPIGGALAAALTASHLLGPWVGRFVDAARDARRPLALGCLWYAGLLLAGAALLRDGSPWLAATCLLAAGCAGPLLTGGLSSLVRRLVGNPARARSADALTYGIAGTAAPGLVGALAATWTATVAVATMVAFAVIAAVLLWLIPPQPHEPTAAHTHRRSAVTLLFSVRALRQVTLTTVAVAFVGGAAGVLAIRLADRLTGDPSRGAWFVAATGVGNLVVAAALVLRPVRIDAVRASVIGAAALGIGYAAVAGVPTVLVGLAAFGAIGMITAVWVTATLAARDEYAPAGQRAQTFVAMAGWKIAAASAGTALGGLVGALGARLPFLCGGLVVVCVAAACFDKRHTLLPMHIDPDSAVPPFEQVRVQLAGQITDGTLPVGTRLPTVRALAGELGLAVNTVARAYRELETAGLVETGGRAGTVVSAAGSSARQRLHSAAQAFAEVAHELGADADQAVAVVRAALAQRGPLATSTQLPARAQ